MDQTDFLRLWDWIRADLSRARGSLREEVADDPNIKQFDEFVDHNELELACDCLAEYGEKNPMNGEFWLSLRDAAAKMKLPGRVAMFERYAEEVKHESRIEGRNMINELLLSEFDAEVKSTRAMLERVPVNPDFKPHAKSMPLGKLAPHVAELAGFGFTILTTPELDFSTGPKRTRVPFESPEQLVKAFDEGAAKVREALKNIPDSAWTESWKLSFQGKRIFSGSRFLAYREMFLNHLVHHRAQLGVYLRMNDKPLPATYGPSADDAMGF